jgi:uncharacterized repeat protein (TIGR01451 family)
MFKRLSNRRKVQASVFIAFLAAIPLAVYAFSASAPPAGRAGDVPNQSCVDPANGCHILPDPAPSPAVVLMGAPGSYIPGQTYDLTVAVSDVAGTRGGFQLVVLDALGASAGTLIDGPDTALTSGSGPTANRVYISHKGAPNPNLSTNRRDWFFRWTAPAANRGTVTFFVTGLAALDNFNDRTNDVIASITQTSQETITVLPSLSISGAGVIEGNIGTTPANFTVTLSPASSQAVTVNFATADESAQAPTDYVARSDTLTFSPGETAKTITISVNGDTSNESDDTFTVNLSNATNAQIDNPLAQGVIINDDAPNSIPSLSISDVSLNEGNSQVTNFNFTVALLPASSQVVTVAVATADDTALAGGDYVALPATTLTFNPGETTKTVMVAVTGDTESEQDEIFFVSLSNPSANANISKGQGRGTILNDDVSSISADLGVLKAASSDTGVVGTDLTYTIAVSNNGPANATGVVLTDTLPADVTFVSASTGCSPSGNTITCNIGNLANGASTTITITVTPTKAGTITNRASVSGNESDPRQSNNTASVTTTITSKPNIIEARVEGKKLIVIGANFKPGARIFVNGKKKKTRNDSAQPLTMLIANKGAKNLVCGQSILIRVENPADPGNDDEASDDFIFRIRCTDVAVPVTNRGSDSRDPRSP